MLHSQRVLDFYKKIGVKAFDDIAHEYRVDDEMPFLQTFCRKTDRILDVACGNGRVTLQLAKKGYDITGVDITTILIREARRRARIERLNIQFDIGDMCRLPYQGGSFDRIICMWNSFNHLLSVKDQKKTLHEMYRVLSKQGKAFIVCMNAEDTAFRSHMDKSSVTRSNIHE